MRAAVAIGVALALAGCAGEPPARSAPPGLSGSRVGGWLTEEDARARTAARRVDRIPAPEGRRAEQATARRALQARLTRIGAVALQIAKGTKRRTAFVAARPGLDASRRAITAALACVPR